MTSSKLFHEYTCLSYIWTLLGRPSTAQLSAGPAFMGLERNLIVVPFVGKFTFKCKTTSWVACLRPRPSNSAAFLRWYSDFQSSPTHRAKESRLYIPRTCARSSFAVQNSCNDEHASPGNKANYTLCAGSKLKVFVYIFQFCIPKQESLEMRLYIYTLVFFCLVPRGLGTRLRPSDIFIFSHVTTCMLICSFMYM